MCVRFWVIVFAVAVVSACASDRDDLSAHPPSANRYLSLPLAERAKMAPNKLFVAVVSGERAGVESELRRDPSLLQTTNGYGDTPLGLALKLGEPVLADELVGRLSTEDFFHQNTAGESYVFLAARAGQPEVIRVLAHRYYNSLPLHRRYAFSHLDPPDKNGQTALFVAAHREVAEILEAEHYRGLVDLPSWYFRLHSDQRSQTFLHQAAADGRADVILWAVGHICRAGSWETSDRWYFSLPASLVEGLKRAIQTYIGDFGLPVDLLFNRQNSDKQTALHMALEKRQWAAARALASCRWLDYNLQDAQGRQPLQVLLAGLNPLRVQIDAETRSLFMYLLNQETLLRRPLWARADRINHPDRNGETTLHYAARLADPYFYNQLKDFGDLNAINKAGQSPRQVFERKASGLRRAPR